jgi:HK97 gp10 family phage protein
MITGVEKLIEKLQTLKKTKSKAALRKGARAGAKIVATAAKRLAPRRTGDLARGIKVKALRRSRVWTGVAIELKAKDVGKDVDTFYAPFVELGTKNMEAVHFLERAAKQNERAAIGKALEIIEQEITK